MPHPFQPFTVQMGKLRPKEGQRPNEVSRQTRTRIHWFFLIPSSLLTTHTMHCPRTYTRRGKQTWRQGVRMLPVLSLLGMGNNTLFPEDMGEAG
jgi:hypothetical protein